MNKGFPKVFSRRKLPHLYEPGNDFFITTRLAGTLPRSPSAKKSFSQLEAELHRNDFGPTWLANPKVAQVISEALFFRNGKVFDLHAFCIMSNHIHIVFRNIVPDGGKAEPISKIMKLFKSFTARQSNLVIGRSGSFWTPESYDRQIRNRLEWERIIWYVINNPVKAKLVDRWENWPWTYCKWPRLGAELGEGE